MRIEEGFMKIWNKKGTTAEWNIFASTLLSCSGCGSVVSTETGISPFLFILFVPIVGVKCLWGVKGKRDKSNWTHIGQMKERGRRKKRVRNDAFTNERALFLAWLIAVGGAEGNNG